MPTQIGSKQARQVWGLPPSQSIATSLADRHTEAANAGDCMITCSSLEQGFASLHPRVWFGDSLYGGSSFCLPFQQALCGAGIASVVQPQRIVDDFALNRSEYEGLLCVWLKQQVPSYMQHAHLH